MVLFDAAELADLQALWASSLDDTATILRPTQTVDASGGRAVTWGTVTTVAGRWQPNRYRAGEEAATGALWAVGPMSIQVPAGTDVQERDRVQRGGDGSLWEVRGTSGPRSFEYGITIDAVAVNA